MIKSAFEIAFKPVVYLPLITVCVVGYAILYAVNNTNDKTIKINQNLYVQ